MNNASTVRTTAWEDDWQGPQAQELLAILGGAWNGPAAA